jgi:CBS domain-containing protein
MDPNTVTVEQLATFGARTVREDATVREAAQAFHEADVGSLVVVDDADRPVGMFTTSDLAAFVATDGSAVETPVSALATDRVVTVDAGASIRDAAARMLTATVHHLAVTDGEGDVVGICSSMDLTAYFSYTDGRDAE